MKDNVSSSAVALAEAATTMCQEQQQTPPSDCCFLFTLLPSDGMDAIFSFLNYRDCLSFGESSLSSLVAIQGSLKTRQKRMTQTFVYPSSSSSGGDDVVGTVQLLDTTSTSQSNRHDWTELPTVRDRVEALCRALPTCHPLSHVVLDLLIDIDENVALQEEDQNQSSSPTPSPAAIAATNNNNKVEQTLLLHRKHCRSHKLHALILSQVIRSNPNSIEHVYYGGGGARSCVATTTTPRFLTVTLDRYIGDVLCAAILMGHAVAGIIEGGPREEDWEHDLECELGMDQVSSSTLTSSATTTEDDMDDLLSLPQLQAMNVPVDCWYRAWIYIHSTLLRTAPFSPTQERHLGMAVVASDSPTRNNPAFPTLALGVAPHRAFMGGDKSVLMHKMSLLSNWEPLRVTFNEFGRLGPTFRGRDLIQSHTIFPAGFISSVKHFSQDEMAVAAKSVRNGDATTAAGSIHALYLRRWLSGEDAVIQWLLEVHGSVGKARPMTVMPPMACFRSGGLE